MTADHESRVRQEIMHELLEGLGTEDIALKLNLSRERVRGVVAELRESGWLRLALEGRKS